MGIHWLDAVIGGIILLSVITGLIRGFVKELIALCIWALAIWLGYHYADILDARLAPWLAEKSIRFIVGFIVIMVSTLIAGGIFNFLLGIIMKKSGLSGTDRLLGMGFGFARGFFIVALGLVVLQMTSLTRQEQMRQSYLIGAFTPAVGWISAQVPSILNKIRDIDQGGQFSHAFIDQDATEAG
ncbi:MAG: CvpA family protein [Legionellaceae bacterium]|nr:CvpA family protein [Legionellaceae bacterium]